MNIQASIVINRPAEAVFAYLASEDHIAVLGQQVEYEQETRESSPEESRPQGESEMKDEGKVQSEGKRRPYIYIPVMINTLNAPLQEMRQVSEGEPGRGTTFVQVYTWRDRTFEIRVVISVYEPARMLAFSISGQPFRPRNKEDQAPPYQPGLALSREPMWLSYILIPLASGTRLTCTIGIANPEGVFYRLAELLAAQGWGKIIKDDLGRLKDLLEGRPISPRKRPTGPTIRGPFKLDVKASIVIKRPIEAVFAYVSETRPTRIKPEMQQERVTRRFLGIFPHTEIHRQPAIKEIRQEPEGPVGVGTRFVQVSTRGRVTYEQVTEISEFEPPRMIAFKLKMIRPKMIRPQKGATGATVFEFGSAAGGQQEQQGEPTLLESKTVLEPVAGGTLVTETMYSDEGCYKLIAPFVAPDERRQLQESLREMKKELEAEGDI